jgi:hypothetical protein
MKIGFRIPSLNKRIAARISFRRIIRHNLGFKAPRGWGWITNPRKAAYNGVYQITSRGCFLQRLAFVLIPIVFSFQLISCTDQSSDVSTYVQPSIDKNGKFRKGHVRKSVSTDKDAFKKRNRSRYYYHTRGKYRRKKD